MADRSSDPAGDPGGGDRRDGGEESPPVGGSWRFLYGLVLAVLAAQVILYTLFARAFR